MIRSILHLTLAATTAIGLCLAGCAAARAHRAADEVPVVLTHPDDPLRIVFHGDLVDRSSVDPRRSWWDELLYGPAPTPDRTLRNPQGMTADGKHLYVCDQGWPAVIRVDLETGEREFLLSARDGLLCPVDVAVDAAGRLFVADTAHAAVLVYPNFAGPADRIAPPIARSAAFVPVALLVHESLLYVADRGGRTVHRFDLAGGDWLSPLYKPDDPGRPALPVALAQCGGSLLVADALGGTVHRMDFAGKTLTRIGRRGRRAGELVRPIGVCATRTGTVFVADAAQQSVAVFDCEGKFLGQVAGSTERWAGLTLPGGVECLSQPPTVYGERSAPMGAGRPGEWVIVSDVLSARRLIVFAAARSGRAFDRNDD